MLWFVNRVIVSTGMKDVFSDKADLSRIDGTKNLKVTDVVHQAFVEVLNNNSISRI